MNNWKFSSCDFSGYPFYKGADLGVNVTDMDVSIKVWAPNAEKIVLLVYKEPLDINPVRIDLLQPEDNGCWSIKLKGNFKGLYYTLRVKYDKWMNETPGVDAKAVGINGKRGLFFINEETDPENWENDIPVILENPVDAIIYEVHVRDFSISPHSGMTNKGKYLAFTEKNTLSPEGFKTGIDHLKELGITHVHLMPIADFSTVDERYPSEKYNWGYDPLNYNAPEGSYSTNPNTTARITELKQLIMALHQAGIGVILDVVYNHTGHTTRSWFNQTIPGFYYRQNSTGLFSNASGCGNEFATERPMVRKFIVESILYWAEYYHIDGFRFDLMGIIDLETIEAIRHALDNLRPGIILYGEGWTADESPLDEKFRAVKSNIAKIQNVACFNDDFRDGIKGDNFNIEDRGFVNGKQYIEEPVKFGIVAACYHPQIVYDYIKSNLPWASEPFQTVNYASSHDNYTLFDKLTASNPDENPEMIIRMHKLALALVLTSQGIPFLHAGVEFCRTKYGDHNSYRSPDNINQIDWRQKNEFKSVFEYVRNLIILRKSFTSFRMRSSIDIRRHLFFTNGYKTGIISYYITDYPDEQKWKTIQLIFNATKSHVDVELVEAGNWTVIVEDNSINMNGIRNHNENKVIVFPISMSVLALEK